jgi:Ca2+/Na+ antiporter
MQHVRELLGQNNARIALVLGLLMGIIMAILDRKLISQDYRVSLAVVSVALVPVVVVFMRKVILQDSEKRLTIAVMWAIIFILGAGITEQIGNFFQ